MKRYFVVIFILLLFACTEKSDVPAYFEINQAWEFKQTNSDKWLKADVPGCVHTDLLTHSLIPDPFVGANEELVQWIENEDFIYRTKFKLDKIILSKDRLELVFEGLDTYAEVFLNDSNILTADNMFQTYTVECKELLQEDNILEIYFKSPVETEAQLWENYPYELPGGQKVMTRKAGFHYGWDWGPRLVSSGIWRPVKIRAWNDMRLADAYISTREIRDDKAILDFLLETEATETTDAELRIACDGGELYRKPIRLPKGRGSYALSATINRPKLWWINGLGDAHLYHFSFEIWQAGQLRDKKDIDFGIRTLELVRQKDEFGESFYFKLNGRPVFMKGANYIPQDNFQNRVSKTDYKELISDVKESNMNMLRVWGGGIYEADYFYELCDKNGILVWQDFMFACAMYPAHEKFLESVKIEAEQNIKRLRNHPCIALWCGNNEIDEAWHNWGWSNQFSPKDSDRIWQGYDTLFHHILPNAVKMHDPIRPYHASSPQYGRGDQRSQYIGDSHYWGVWHDAEPFEMYREKVPRFMSEFGFQSFPDMTTIRSFAPDSALFIESEIMKTHQKHPRGNALIKEYMAREYSVPEDFEEFVYVSQVMQAEGIKTGIEAHRMAWPYCGGTLYWQLNDCWPVVSWSGRDYYGRWKALQYFVMKVYRSEIIVCSEESDQNAVDIWIASDAREDISAVLDISIGDFQGRMIQESESNFEIAANEGQKYQRITFDEIWKSHSSDAVLLRAQLKSEGRVIAENIHYFKKVKDLKLPAVHKIRLKIEHVPEGYALTLHSDALVKNLYLNCEKPGQFSDNYFDLLPGTFKRILFYTDADTLSRAELSCLCMNNVLLDRADMEVLFVGFE